MGALTLVDLCQATSRRSRRPIGHFRDFGATPGTPKPLNWVQRNGIQNRLPGHGVLASQSIAASAPRTKAEATSYRIFRVREKMGTPNPNNKSRSTDSVFARYIPQKETGTESPPKEETSEGSDPRPATPDSSHSHSEVINVNTPQYEANDFLVNGDKEIKIISIEYDTSGNLVKVQYRKIKPRKMRKLETNVSDLDGFVLKVKN